MSSTSLLVLFALMIGLAGFSSWARLSLLSLKPSQFKKLLGERKKGEEEQGRPEKADGLLLSMVVSGSAAKIAAPLIMFAWLGRVAPTIVEGWRGVVSFAASAGCVLLISEAVPRVLLDSHREPRMRIAIVPVFLLNLAVLPVRLVIQRMSRLMGKLLGRDAESLTLWPLQTGRAVVWDAEGKETQLEEDEKVLISSIRQMTETIVREVMVPRVDMHCLEENKTLGQLREQILQTGHSRFPVYASKVDNIVGVFLAKDILRYSSQEEVARVKVKDVMHPITFVPETKNVSDLLREFQQTRQHMAVVVDEYGGTAGLVTIEDLLEEIVGEIEDEFDHERKLFVETKDGGYIVDAKMSVGDVAEELRIEFPDNSGYDTMGGFVVAMLGEVPHQGKSFRSDGVVVTVLEADDRRVHRVKLLPLSEKEKGSDEKKGGKE